MFILPDVQVPGEFKVEKMTFMMAFSRRVECSMEESVCLHNQTAANAVNAVSNRSQNKDEKSSKSKFGALRLH